MAGHTRELYREFRKLLQDSRLEGEDVGRQSQSYHGTVPAVRAGQRRVAVHKQQLHQPCTAQHVHGQGEPDQGRHVREHDRDDGADVIAADQGGGGPAPARILHRRQSLQLQLLDGLAAGNQQSDLDQGISTDHGPGQRDVSHVRPTWRCNRVRLDGQIRAVSLPIRGPLFRPVPLLRFRRLRLRDDLSCRLQVLQRPHVEHERGGLFRVGRGGDTAPDPDGRDRGLPGR